MKLYILPTLFACGIALAFCKPAASPPTPSTDAGVDAGPPAPPPPPAPMTPDVKAVAPAPKPEPTFTPAPDVPPPVRHDGHG